MDLPSLFGSKGHFAPLPDELIGTLDEQRAVAYAKIAQCADAIKAADDKLALAVENVQARIKAVQDFESFIVAHFPKVTFMDLWKASRQ
jgi:hypothetical protein